MLPSRKAQSKIKLLPSIGSSFNPDLYDPRQHIVHSIDFRAGGKNESWIDRKKQQTQNQSAVPKQLGGQSNNDDPKFQLGTLYIKSSAKDDDHIRQEIKLFRSRKLSIEGTQKRLGGSHSPPQSSLKSMSELSHRFEPVVKAPAKAAQMALAPVSVQVKTLVVQPPP